MSEPSQVNPTAPTAPGTEVKPDATAAAKTETPVEAPAEPVKQSE